MHLLAKRMISIYRLLHRFIYGCYLLCFQKEEFVSPQLNYQITFLRLTMQGLSAVKLMKTASEPYV